MRTSKTSSLTNERTLTHNQWAYPCSTPPHITFALGHSGQRFALHPLDIQAARLPKTNSGFTDIPGKSDLANAEKSATAYCLASVLGSFIDHLGKPHRVWLGIPFLKSWYSVFSAEEPPRIGLAEAVLGNVAWGGDEGGGVGGQGPGAAPHVGASVASSDEGTVDVGR